MKYYILHIAKSVITKSWCFLRASGGVSDPPFVIDFHAKFSPRKRRCFRERKSSSSDRTVFSAQAEVFLTATGTTTLSTRFLRASGGVSSGYAKSCKYRKFSPRKRRCFRLQARTNIGACVFSAQAEVFLVQLASMPCLASFLRASGGVSTRYIVQLWSCGFSPRKRRCF